MWKNPGFSTAIAPVWREENRCIQRCIKLPERKIIVLCSRGNQRGKGGKKEEKVGEFVEMGKIDLGGFPTCGNIFVKNHQSRQRYVLPLPGNTVADRCRERTRNGSRPGIRKNGGKPCPER